MCVLECDQAGGGEKDGMQRHGNEKLVCQNHFSSAMAKSSVGSAGWDGTLYSKVSIGRGELTSAPSSRDQDQC